MKSLTGPVIKSLLFVVVTVVATTALALTITNGNSGGGHRFRAVFTDVTSLNKGDDIRMAGVRVGQVKAIRIVQRNRAEVTFTVQFDVRLARTASASIRYRNLIGQRYIALDEGDGSLDDHLDPGDTITRTTPALNLTVLFNGFRPLLRALSPDDINRLTASVIQVFQGEGPSVGDLVSQTASLTNTLADKDTVIGQVVDNLNAVLAAVNGRGNQFATLISTLQSLVSGLAQDRAPLTSAITGIGRLTTDVGDLLAQGRAPLKASIGSLQQLSANLAGSSGALNSFLQRLPTKLDAIGRTASYGSWLNFYLCSVTGRIPVPTGYYGDAGAQPVASRCTA